MLYDISSSCKNIPIYIIGAGGIVNTAHLPAYKIAGFNVQGIYDIDHNKAVTTASNFNLPNVFSRLQEMIAQAPANAVFELAVPGSQTIDLLSQLPVAATVLVQKPMGENYSEAKQILELTQQKKMLAGINFQLRYAPYNTTVEAELKNGKLIMLKVLPENRKADIVLMSGTAE